MKTLIKNALIVNSSEKKYSDILIEKGKISKIGKLDNYKNNSVEIIDASGYLVFPGAIDAHVHMQLQTPTGLSADTFETGSKAALSGGTTTIIDFVTPEKGQNLISALKARKHEARNCYTDFTFHVSPIEWHEGIAEEIHDCISLYGINSFKSYMAYKKHIGLDNDDLKKIMTIIAKNKGVLALHCEKGDSIQNIIQDLQLNNKLGVEFHPISRPPHSEYDAVEEAIALAKETDCTLYIVHVSTKTSLEYIVNAKLNGQKIYAETCPQYLFFDDQVYKKPFESASEYVCSPPLRKKDDLDSLWKAISNNDIDVISTDHCPFASKQKEKGKLDFTKIPGGVGGVEHRLSLLYSYGVLKQGITVNQFVDLIATNPAKIFGLFPQKGQIEVGSDADIILWDPDFQKTISRTKHTMNCDIDIYDGIQTKGAPFIVIKDGKKVLKDYELVNDLSPGTFLGKDS